MAMWVAPVAMVAGTMLLAYSAYQEGKTAEEMGQYNQQVAARDEEAKVEAAAHEEVANKQESEKMKARMRALYGKAGVQMEGTPLEVLGAAAADEEFDTLAIRRTGAVAASRARSTGALYGYEAQAQARSAYTRAGTSLLTGASNVAMMYQMNQRPVQTGSTSGG